VAGGTKDSIERAVYRGGVRSTDRPFEQSHLIYAFSAPSYRDPNYFSAQVLSGILGGGMSSRLFQEVREERGLCYAIYTSGWGVRDAGLFVVHAATSIDLVEDLSAVSSQCLAKMAEEGPTEKEVLRARAQLKAGLMMSLESSAARAEQMARHLLAHDRLISPDELVAKVERVDCEAIRACAERMIAGPACAVVVGSGEAAQKQAEAAADKLVQNIQAQ